MAKTTTTSIAAWLYTDTGQDPGFLIGGVPHDLGRSFARGGGERFIIEGDEYNAAYFDRGPKFLHYQPQTLILTSVEYDHADLYPTPESLLEAYRELVRLLPDDGLLIAWGDSPEVREVAAAASCRVVFYGISPRNDVHPADPIEEGPESVNFTLQDPQAGRVEFSLNLAGAHNVLNAMAVWIAARADGIAASDAAASLSNFGGVRRRMDELGTVGGITVVDDFAHHPTAIGSTIEALRGRYRDRRLLVLFEPRSLTAARAFLHPQYLSALAKADVALLAPIFHRSRFYSGGMSRHSPVDRGAWRARSDCRNLRRPPGTARLDSGPCATRRCGRNDVVGRFWLAATATADGAQLGPPGVLGGRHCRRIAAVIDSPSLFALSRFATITYVVLAQ